MGLTTLPQCLSEQVELVARACCEYMKAHFHPSNCLAVRTFAESHNRVDLMDMADRYACEHFREVVDCEDFPCVSPQHLRTLLSSGELNIHSETQVYNAAVKWLKANPQNHEAWLDQIMSQVCVCVFVRGRGYLSSCVYACSSKLGGCRPLRVFYSRATSCVFHASVASSQVRLPLLPVDFLTGTVAKEEMIKANLSCRDLLDEARNYHLHLSNKVVPDFEYSVRTTPRKHTAGEAQARIILRS